MDFALSPDQKTLADTVRTMAEREFAAHAYQYTSFPWSSLKTLARSGYTGITIAVDDGGQGGTLLDAVLVMEAVTKVCPHSGDAVQVSNFGAIRQIATFGSDELKREVLPILLAGDGLATAGMSEPEAGSALTELTTRATKSAGDVVLDGIKCWNSHGPDASHVVVWCRFGPRTSDIGAVVVPTDAYGLKRGPAQEYLSGERHCTLYFDECRVPQRYLITDQGAVGKMFTVFEVERIGNAVRALALGEAAFDMAVAHAAERMQFNRTLSTFQGLQWKFADMRTRLDAARLLVYRAAASVTETGQPDPRETATAKLFANETAFAVANDALQIFGARGYTLEEPINYLFRRTRGWMIAGGSVEIMRNRIAEAVFQRRFNQRPEPAQS